MLGGRPLIVALALLIIPVAPGLALGDDPGTAAPPEPVVPVENPVSEVLEPGLLDTMGDEVHGVIVQFDDEVPADLADIPGIQPAYTFESIPAAYVLADAAGVRLLSDAAGVRYVEDAWKPVGFLLDSATLASRARDVWDPATSPETPPMLDMDGRIVDGSGIGVAMLDTGVDGTHPDFLATGKLGANYLVTPAGLIDAPYSTPTSPHGTAVAGVVAGTGAASNGQYAGAAPGASIHSFNIQPSRGGLHVLNAANPADAITLYPAVALDWILAHGHEQDPPIRVVQNAWHCRASPCGTFDPDQAHNRLASELAQVGYVLTWAAGEFNPPGAGHGIIPEATNPTPGILGITAYNDENFGLRDRCTGRAGNGNALDVGTWPDLAAPGTHITTTAASYAGPNTRVGELRRTYDRVEGTSVASAHVAGVAALVLDANATLTPAEIEYLLETTAHDLTEADCSIPYARADPANPWDAANYVDGHGLVDAYAAVQAASSFTGIPEERPEPEEVPASMVPSRDGIHILERTYLQGTGSLGAERPTGPDSRSRVAEANEAIAFTSDPLDRSLEVSGIDASLWIAAPRRATSNAYDVVLADTQVTLILQRLGPGGDVLQEASAGAELLHQARFAVDAARGGLPGDPAEHPIVAALEAPLTLTEGDRLRALVAVEDSGALGPGSEITHWLLSWGSSEHPSHIGLGQGPLAVAPGGYEECRRYSSCGWADADHPDPRWACEANAVFRLSWYGPPGSSASLTCDLTSASCTVPGDPGDPWAECVAFSHDNGPRRHPGECRFELPSEAGQAPPMYRAKCEMVFD